MDPNDTLEYPQADTARLRGPRPVPAGVEYHRVLAGEKRRIGRGILAIVLLVAGMFVFAYLIALATASIDARMGRTNPSLGGTDYTPLYHSAGMISIALLIPWSMFLQRWLYGVRGASLHSVASRLRFDLVGKALVFIGPIWLAAVLTLNASEPADRIYWPGTELIVMLGLILVLTPLQTAGEEYGLRGLVFRVAGSWSHGPRVSLVLAVLVSSLVTTPIHGASDVWINIWYMTLSISLALITWRTGGLEIAIVIHAVLNTLTFLVATALHADIGASVMDRSEGVGGPVLMVPAATVAVIAAVVWWRTRKTGPALTPGDPRSVRA